MIDVSQLQILQVHLGWLKKKVRSPKDKPVGYHMGWTMWLCIQPCAASSGWKVTNSHLSPCPPASSQKVLLPSFLYLISPSFRSWDTPSVKPSRHLPPSSLPQFLLQDSWIESYVPSQLYGCAHDRVASTLHHNKLVWICNWVGNILRAQSSSFSFAFPVFSKCWMNVF